MAPSTNAPFLTPFETRMPLGIARRCGWSAGLGVLALACSGCGTSTHAASLAFTPEASLGSRRAPVATSTTIISNPALQRWLQQFGQDRNEDQWEPAAVEYRLAELPDRRDIPLPPPRAGATEPAISLGVLARDDTLAQFAGPREMLWSDFAAELLLPADVWTGLPISRIDPISPLVVTPRSSASKSYAGGERLLHFGALAFLTTILIVPAMCSIASRVVCRRQTARSPPRPKPVEAPGPRFDPESEPPAWPGVYPIADRGQAPLVSLGRCISLL